MEIGMTAKVIIGRQESDPFEVLAGVKQGCVLAPVIFNLFLVAVMLVFRNKLSADCGIPFKYSLDGNIFNLRRLQAQTLCMNFNAQMMLLYRVTHP